VEKIRGRRGRVEGIRARVKGESVVAFSLFPFPFFCKNFNSPSLSLSSPLTL
jgi:hypothetical protein